MSAFIVILGTIAYLQAGYFLGRIGWSVWKRRDNLSFRSYLFFPSSHLRRRVGAGTMSLFQGVNPEEGAYRAAMLLFWPVAAVLSLAVVAVTLPGWMASRPERIRAANVRKLHLLETQNRALDAYIRRLETGDVTTHAAPVTRIVEISDDEGEEEETAAARRTAG